MNNLAKQLDSPLAKPPSNGVFSFRHFHELSTRVVYQVKHAGKIYGDLTELTFELLHALIASPAPLLLTEKVSLLHVLVILFLYVSPSSVSSDWGETERVCEANFCPKILSLAVYAFICLVGRAKTSACVCPLI